MRICRAIAIIVALSVTFSVAAEEQGGQDSAWAVLEYFESSSGDFMIKTPDDEELYAEDLDFGFRIPVGSIVVTFDGDSAEIRLDPNSSIIRISENTNFVIEGLQGVGGAEANTFSMAVGKVRFVAAKMAGKPLYRVKGPSAVCGVRGTDFGFHVLPGEIEQAFTFSGLIEFTDKAGKTLEIAAGQFADAMADVFAAAQMGAEMAAALQEELGFTTLDESSVEGHVPSGADEAAEEEGEDDEKESSPPPRVVTTTPERVEDTSSADDTAEEGAEETAEAPAEESEFMRKLREILGMEIGSQAFSGEIYAKAVLQPTFVLGKLKLALYLPIIYKSNMFDPEDWYHPEGNDEWSFGTDQDGALDIIRDIGKDLFLKIRSVEYGKQRDPFFLKVGNLNNITLGTGFVMRNFANDADFPSVRRVGLNIGVDRPKIGFELMANDLASLPPEIFGGRFYVKPVSRLALGVTAAADINPSGSLLTPLILAGGLNAEFPVVNTDAVSVVLFADSGLMLPYFSEDYLDPVTGLGVDAGMKLESVYDPTAPLKLKNYGFAAGVLGHIFIADYRLEYRYFTGTFQPAYFDRGYERRRLQEVSQIVSYLNDPLNPEYNTVTMGIYGEAGFNILEKVNFSVGYMFPWSPGMSEMPDDYFKATVGLAPDVIPVVGIYGSIEYERTKFVPTLLGQEDEAGPLLLFDANTIVRATLVYPVAEIIDLALLVTTTVARDAAGNIVYVVDDLGAPTARPDLDTSVNIEMQVHF